MLSGRLEKILLTRKSKVCELYQTSENPPEILKKV